MKLIGLTGGIGSGKSTVARLLAERGWSVVDADQIAREIVEPGEPALAELVEAFGADILDEAGTLQRAELARRAFVDAEHTAKLNAITHPRIQERTQERFAEARVAGVEYCVYDMPLLVDNGLDRDMDEVLVVNVDVEERVRRLVAHRGLDEADARRRIAQQVPDEVRLAAATYVIDNNGVLEDLALQVDRVAAAIEKAE
ncbi:dephospho-CoA kinase [Corynebacterium sp. CMW7794]|uniref:dephospho-CoA kinase n=1 Tax=Corynebacterium TaxID=1716 RepID=UPI0007921EC6|nr:MULTISPECIES: dephospho-CoA kinase [Corynebacterium]KXB56716.1 dephospho-CoA kinase [Corynebacterium sp. DNF00584]KXI18874.1 dephospho-CoA kinase [Corynebacterium sp. CMW7794]MBF9011623.1 dephospho-CoA kinase [Corynebacterium phoceense]OFL78165.1 dephospho-CoA kinase [Corynebacterium sp. HMSC077B05]OFN41071.1 dephospho-CoA kinase [Corynebacterium sp. HMSC072G08]